MSEIGIKPGEKFDINSFDGETQASLKTLPAEVFKGFDNYSAETFEGSKKTGSSLGSYQTDYLKRAFVAYKGLGALGPKDAVSGLVTVLSEVVNGNWFLSIQNLSGNCTILKKTGVKQMI